MKKSELRQIIREELKSLKEAVNKFDATVDRLKGISDELMVTINPFLNVNI